MPNTKSAKKAMRRDQKRYLVNHARKNRIKTFQKKFLEVLGSKDVNVAKQAFIEVQSETMRGVTKGVLAKRAASRKIKRLNARLKKLSTEIKAG